MSFKRDLKNSTLYEARYQVKEKRSSYFFYLFIALLICGILFLRWYWIENFGGVTVSGHSMDKTLYTGEQLLMQYTDGSDAERGDIIVVYVGEYEEFNDPVAEEYKTKYLIKRLIAIEGDSVRCTDGQIEIKYAGASEWVNLDEPYAYYVNKEEYDFSEYVVGAGEVFFLGDNRNNSQDSRYMQIGGSRLDCLYKRADIVGIVPDWAIKHQKILGKIFFRNVKK
ncbi:MAG: signal peptidase I [Clostridia bacterium]|nr:signal peptidase I [Clostridia bacterium]